MTIKRGTPVAHSRNRATRMGRVRWVMSGRASVYWVRLGRASTVRLDLIEAIDETELVTFFDQQEALYQTAWRNIRADDEWPSITQPAGQPRWVQNFIRTGRDSV